MGLRVSDVSPLTAVGIFAAVSAVGTYALYRAVDDWDGTVPVAVSPAPGVVADLEAVGLQREEAKLRMAEVRIQMESELIRARERTRTVIVTQPGHDVHISTLRLHLMPQVRTIRGRMNFGEGFTFVLPDNEALRSRLRFEIRHELNRSLEGLEGLEQELEGVERELRAAESEMAEGLREAEVAAVVAVDALRAAEEGADDEHHRKRRKRRRRHP